ncbi:ion transporter [Aquisalimonas lutea]|uniref:ion transporter n=1 Tax=Aquisalimonas lutea TaxID=1327750 RepID=UPI0025B61D3D|nr:ion transporter [Aquisalimonas lutea]MDN3518932.1 ion transporter [Aquisalimonas lutea]
MEYSASWGLRSRLGAWIEHRRVQTFIIVLICINAVTLGLETFDVVQRHFGGALALLESAVLAVFVLEIVIKLVAFDYRFFRDGWNVFDFAIVGISLMPASGPFTVLRALRILRVLRLVAKVGRLRMIVESLLRAIPSIGWIAFLLGLVFYIFGVIGTKLFGDGFPDDFGHLGLTLYSLFQVMTLESWSEEIARPVMEQHPLAWVYFISFIMLSAFTVLNLFIGIIVNTMQEGHMEEADAKRRESEQKAHWERERMLRLIEELHEKVERLEQRDDRR